ncbi:MAG: hypothetical protein IT370_12145 [Deltaproteobacteria bacterium]|nr:hypothetical protein [Deltaproteobacteria bacterium]
MADDPPLELARRPGRPAASPDTGAGTPEPNFHPERYTHAPEREDAAAHVGRVLTPALSLLVAIPASFLPAPWRHRLHLDRTALGPGTVLGCLIVSVAAVLLGAHFYQAFLDDMAAERLATLRQLAEAGAEKGQLSYGPMMVVGLQSYLEFLVTPAGLGCVYLFGESLVRGAAVAGGFRLPTLPLWLLELARAGVAAVLARHRLGALVPDELTRGPGGVLWKIATCRERGWNRETTLSYQDRFYQVTQMEDRGAGPRRFLYTVRQSPPELVIRHFVGYAPDALLPLHRRDAGR